MGHKFNPKNIAKLDNPDRRRLLPPEEVILKMGISQGEKIVDLGCGIGYFTFPLAKAVGAKGTVYGIDILQEMLEEARLRYENNEVRTLDNIQFVRSDENVLPLEDQTADGVIMVNVFHELDEPDELLGEIKRVLKDEGKIFIIEWKKEDMDYGPPTEHRKSEVEIINSLSNNGYEFQKSIELPPAHLLVEALSK